MTTNQNTQNNSDELNDLLDEAKKLNQEIKEDNKKTIDSITKIEQDVDESIKKVDEYCSDLDKAEKEADEEFNKIDEEEKLEKD